MTTQFSYNFEWDPKKARLNLNKHNTSFEQATAVFQDPLALSVADREHSEHEERWITLGLDGTSRLLVVIHTYRQENDQGAVIWIISARKATTKERQYYEETGQ